MKNPTMFLVKLNGKIVNRVESNKSAGDVRRDLIDRKGWDQNISVVPRRQNTTVTMR